MGFGGSCLPKDLKALKKLGADVHGDTPLLTAIEAVNERQKMQIGNKIHDYFDHKGGLHDKTIGILGLSFKPDTNDMREAPSLVLIDQLLRWGAKLRVYDPVAMDCAKKVIPPTDRIAWCASEIDVSEDADALVLVTEWKQFRFLDFEKILEKMSGTAFFDGRNQYSSKKMSDLGFDYISIGKAASYSMKNKEKHNAICR
jgi:UDPglucose 6-dehydrogenase